MMKSKLISLIKESVKSEKKLTLKERKRKKLRENQGSFPKSKEEINSICEKYGIKNYTINGDMTVDVDGDVELDNISLRSIPLKFKKVTGTFDCSFNSLKTLEGSPQIVGDSFICSFNDLKSLEYSPTTVSEVFDASNNMLKTLKGSLKKVGGDFNIRDNNLTSLDGLPKVGGKVMSDLKENRRIRRK